jgi:hypothetical protein
LKIASERQNKSLQIAYYQEFATSYIGSAQKLKKPMIATDTHAIMKK